MITVSLSNAGAYDEALHSPATVPQAGDIMIITKDDGTCGGRAAAVIAFDIEVEGKTYLAQATMTVRNLIMALRILDSRYEDGIPLNTARDYKVGDDK